MSNTSAVLQEKAKEDGLFWGNEVSKAYFERAERDMNQLWSDLISPVLDGLEYDTALDIAAGHGRNAVKLAERAKRVICVDINEDNVEFMQERFRGNAKFSILKNDGVTLDQIDASSIDLAYSFDSMVHFDLDVVRSYLSEIYRVLKPGKFAFLHHSNYMGNPGADFRRNPHWRNFMSIELFQHLSIRAGFSVLVSTAIPWGLPNLDGIALLQRPI